MMIKTTLVVLGCAVALSGCVQRPRAGDMIDIYERSSHTLANAPDAAAECIVRNASGEGYFGAEQPLYGTSAMSVSVRTFEVGDTLASITLLPASSGSRATATTIRGTLKGDRAAFLDSLLKGC